MKVHVRIAAALVALATVAVAAAAPGLLVTKPPVGPVPSWTGPTNDPHAELGQWFRNNTGAVEVRPWEFYDNVIGFGGGFRSHLAIEGYVQNVALDPFGSITGFQIVTTITNDLPGEGPWEEQTNSHGEFRSGSPRYIGDMYGVKFTASFADDGILGNFPGPQGVYFGSEQIYAMNYEQLAWYCWTPENPDPAKAPWGDYMVPTYDFGTIPMGQSVTRTLGFGFYQPLAATDALHTFLLDAQTQQFDVLMNRTTSLKISDYFDTLGQDNGQPYRVVGPAHGSDCSVFFVPEPAAVLMLALVAVLVIRRR